MYHENFYVACATIIPVLFIAFIWQVEPFGKAKDADWGDVASVVVFVVFSIAGEAAALHVLRQGSASVSDAEFVADATWFNVLLTLLSPALPFVRTVVDRVKHERLRSILHNGVALLLAAAAVFVTVVVNPI